MARPTSLLRTTPTVTRLRVALAVLAITLGAVGTTIALADHVAVQDMNDTRGLMDLRRVEVAGTKRPRFSITTFERWRVVEIFDYGFTLVHLDTISTPRFDYYALVRSDGIKLRASLWRDRATKRDYRIAKLSVWRQDRSNITMRVPLRLMKVGGRRVTYGWIVETIFTSDECRRTCLDFAPDEGRIDEPLPLPEPTASPTPSPTPTTP